MKNLLKTSILLFSIVLLSSFILTDANSDIKDVIGTWNYSVPNAPVEYQIGELILEDKEGELYGYTLIGEYKNEIIKPKLEGNNLTFIMYIEDTDVSFNLNFKKNQFTGIVSYSEGTLDITGERKK
ncbi:hypothetical protein [Aureibaculum conchae]|uniref:hypothetical protein n=1 Tax=Aureibaculum sp. 2308TA14-22 TaxID=3108392 RepID=UPI0033956B31